MAILATQAGGMQSAGNRNGIAADSLLISPRVSAMLADTAAEALHLNEPIRQRIIPDTRCFGE